MLVSRSASIKVLLLCFLPTLVYGDATADLGALEEEFFKWGQQIWPVFAIKTGSRAYNDRVEDLSLETFDTKLARVQEFLLTLYAIDRGQLSRQHQYSYDVLHNMLSTFEANYPWRKYGPLNPINCLAAFHHSLIRMMAYFPLKRVEDFDHYIARLKAYPTQIDQMMDRMNLAIQMGTTQHLVSVRTVSFQLMDLISTAPLKSGVYQLFNTTLGNLNLTQQHREDMRARALTAVKQLWTALGRLKTYMMETYLRNTRVTYGVYGLPEGQDYYRACLRWHLSVDMTPEQVHQKGLQEVERITQLMHQVIWNQSLDGTIKEYYSQLMADPRFKLNSTGEIHSLLLNRAYLNMPPLFKDIPPFQDLMNPAATDGLTGLYGGGQGTGTFFFDLHRAGHLRTYNLMSLILHEMIPGHQLQSFRVIASRVPRFQKSFGGEYYAVPFEFPFFSAQLEGWAVYAEFLGEDMGVYLNDYEMMGRYGEEMLHACRLVVDTGLHYFGWSRDRAIQYLSDRIPYSRATIEMEVDRYITLPGQACAYKIGELKIKELRQKAATALGSKFDIRDFHSLLLSHGRMPLSVMETIVDDYIEDCTEGKCASGSAPSVHHVSASTVETSLFLVSLVFALTRPCFQ